MKKTINNISTNNSKNALPEKLSNSFLSDDYSNKRVVVSKDNLKTVEKNIKYDSKSRNNIYIKNSFSSNINIIINSKDKLKDNIEEYLKTEIDEMDYDNAIKIDKRKFCEYFYYKLKVNQITLNTFYLDEPLRPKPIKFFELKIINFIFRKNTINSKI